MSRERAARREARIQQLQTERDLRQLALFERIPELREIHELQARIAVEMGRAVLHHRRQFPDKSPAELAEWGRELSARFQTVLREHGVDPRELEVWWDCPHCRNTGWITPDPAAVAGLDLVPPARKCECLLQEEAEDLYKVSGLRGPHRRFDFAHFDLTLWPDHPGPDTGGVTYREYMAGVRDRCIEFARMVAEGGSPKSICLMGDVGRGKTFLACAIANYLLEHRRTVLYITFNEFVDFARRSKFEGNDYQEWRQFWQEASLCVLDDVGAEHATPFVIQELYSLLNTRMMDEKPFIFVTNVTNPLDLEQVYTARIASRVLLGATWIKVLGPDLRGVLKARGA